MKAGEEMGNLEEAKKEEEDCLLLDNQSEIEFFVDIPCHEKDEGFKIACFELKCESESENGETCGGTFFVQFHEDNITVCAHGTLIFKIQCNVCKQKTEVFITMNELIGRAKSVYNAELAEKNKNDDDSDMGLYL